LVVEEFPAPPELDEMKPTNMQKGELARADGESARRGSIGVLSAFSHAACVPLGTEK
jgi:hypothetical protein